MVSLLRDKYRIQQKNRHEYERDLGQGDVLLQSLLEVQVIFSPN